MTPANQQQMGQQQQGDPQQQQQQQQQAPQQAAQTRQNAITALQLAQMAIGKMISKRNSCSFEIS